MGGLGPGIGGMEWLVIGLVALLVVGPERLPGMLREMGKWVAKARGMANEFRASFDDMARQSELDDLRREVEALRTNAPVKLGAEADAAFKDIKAEFDKPLFDTTSGVEAKAPEMMPAPSEWPVDTGEVVDTSAPETPAVAKPRRKATTSKAATKLAEPKVAKPKPAASRVAASKANAAPKTVKPRASRAKVADQ